LARLAAWSAVTGRAPERESQLVHHKGIPLPGQTQQASSACG
jgi:hypothetical protein